MGILIELDVTGDTRLMWDKDKPDEVKAAKARYDELKAKGYTAYTDDGKGGNLEVVHRFDPKAERLSMHSQMAGG